MADGKKQFRIGIDLGTSRTAIMTERGTRADFMSVVGYPRDIIGTKLLNGTKAIGDEVMEKRSFLDVYFPLENGVIKETSEIDMEAARDLLKHALLLAKPEPGEEVCVVIGVPARASFSNRESLLKLAHELTDVTLVVSEPFLVAYGMNELTKSIVVDIGAGTTDICALKGTVPNAEDQATISKGGNYVDKVLRALLLERYPDIQVSKHMVQKIKEQNSFVGEIKEPIMIEFRANGKPKQYDVSKEIKDACETLVLPIIEQIEYLLMRFDPDDQAEALRHIYLAGNGSRIRGMDAAIVEALQEYGEINVMCVDDPDYACCKGALGIAMDLPVAHWNQIGDVIGT
ncbi:MamK family actin-like protein [Deltaproteobacteria bacterium TL4]